MNAFAYMRKYKLVAFAAVVWLSGIVTWVTYQVFTDVTKINTEVNVALGIIYGLPPIVVGLIKWRQESGRSRSSTEGA